MFTPVDQMGGFNYYNPSDPDPEYNNLEENTAWICKFGEKGKPIYTIEQKKKFIE